MRYKSHEFGKLVWPIIKQIMQILCLHNINFGMFVLISLEYCILIVDWCLFPTMLLHASTPLFTFLFHTSCLIH